jgi:hypothetical protein
MAIRAHLTDSNAFDPEVVEAMSKAFHEACKALQIFAGDVRGREAVATRVIDMARKGVTDPSTVVQHILSKPMAVT